jgi:hypothetical protein
MRRSSWAVVLCAFLLGACAVEGEDVGSGSNESAIEGEDGLAEAYAQFKQDFIADGKDVNWRVGFGPHPGLQTEALGARGSVTLGFGDGHVRAELSGVPDGAKFDLWLVKNVPGGSVKPEPADPAVKLGTFSGTTGTRTLDVVPPATALHFDLDLVVVTRKGKKPRQSVIAVGARTLFEKRFFREKAGLPMDAVTGALSDTVETTDALVRRGAQLFFDETFGGNGRTCGTCHRLENNLTIDAEFIKKLPPEDPLFVFEREPALAGLEDGVLLREKGLIRENLDGLEAPTTKFVMRNTPHTLAMSLTIGDGTGPGAPNDNGPPDQRTGWSGDGAPGRGTLNEFAFGAIVQHFPRSLARVPGVDFRIPTQEELDALEAFQLFSGRQKNPSVGALTFGDAAANAGRDKFLGQAFCVACHLEMTGRSGAHIAFMFDTGVERLSRALGLPVDGGLGHEGSAEAGFGTGRFNIPPLVEAADTAPFFHNGAVGTIEEAVAFYLSDNFRQSPMFRIFGAPQIDAQGVNEIGAFLRVINAAENLRQSRKRVEFVADHRGPGNQRILEIALEDLQDAIDVLEARGLGQSPGANAVQSLRTAKQTIEIAIANPDEARAAFLQPALQWMGVAKGQLIPGNPQQEF